MFSKIISSLFKKDISTNCFNIETEPAVRYFDNEANIDFSLYWQSHIFTKNLKKEIIEKLRNGVKNGKSYTQIAKEIHLIDPLVTTKQISKSIAIHQIGRAYWYANYSPALVLEKQWYILEKEWVTSKDDKVCKACLKNEKAGFIWLHEIFPWTKDEFAPSATEITCRCTSTHKITGIKG